MCEFRIPNEKRLNSQSGIRTLVIFLVLNRSSCLPALYPSALHQAVVLAHEQLGFDLLEGIENYTHHDQQ